MNAPKYPPLPSLPPIGAPLLAWYDRGHRDLPWRREPTPYGVWVSEIMLQQTRVEAVKPYYARFMEALPDVRALAEVPDEVLYKLWEGLGYYSRARNLKRAAVEICEKHGGQLPADYEALLALCGIGSYTAGAIASIAFGIPSPAVDGNVLRVVARLLASDRNVLEPAFKREVEQAILPVIPQDRAGDFTQAMIELGATVCTPTATEQTCAECPLSHLCAARRSALVGILPIRHKNTRRREEKRTVLVITDGERVLLRRRPDTGLLAGLWEFPHLPEHLSEAQVAEQLTEWGIAPSSVRKTRPATHLFTHIKWDMTGYLIRTDKLEDNPAGQAISLVEAREQYAIPSAFSAFCREVFDETV